MVKFKSRYILVETLYENERNQPFDGGKIAIVLKNAVENFFGDVGLGKLNKNLQVKYMNNYTNMLIVRCGKEFVKLLWTAIAMIFNFNPTVNEIGFYISALVGVFIGFWLTPKLSDRIFKE